MICARCRAPWLRNAQGIAVQTCRCAWSCDGCDDCNGAGGHSLGPHPTKEQLLLIGAHYQSNRPVEVA